MKALLAILFLIFGLLSINIVAQTQEKEFSGYAIRFQQRDELASFYPIIGSGIDVGFTVSPLMTQDSNYSILVSMINLSAKRQGDEWDLTVTVTLPKGGGIKVMAVGRLKDGEKLKVDKFAEYDLFPSEVSIVKIDPIPARPALVTNLTSSIEVSVEASIVPMPYRIVLKNASNKAVEAVEVSSYKGMRRRMVVASPEGRSEHSLIEPGATYKIEMPTAADYKAVAAGEYQPDQAGMIEVATVVFADGTFEGKPHLAEIIDAKMIGERAQLDRVLPLIGDAIASPDSGTAQAVADFRQAVLSLDTGGDQSYSAELRKRFPLLDENRLKDIDRDVRFGLEKVRSLVLGDVAEFKRESAKTGSNSFHDWLRKEQEKAERWRSRLGP